MQRIKVFDVVLKNHLLGATWHRHVRELDAKSAKAKALRLTNDPRVVVVSCQVYMVAGPTHSSPSIERVLSSDEAILWALNEGATEQGDGLVLPDGRRL